MRCSKRFQPTRPLRGATVSAGAHLADRLISTHAPLAGRDSLIPRTGCGSQTFQPTRPLRGATGAQVKLPKEELDISTHAPLAGRDGFTKSVLVCGSEFQPTRPLRGATIGTGPTIFPVWDFNPRAPCGARQQKCTNHYAHFCDNRQISDAFAQNAACQGILLLFDAGKPCGFWVRTAQVISARLCFAL